MKNNVSTEEAERNGKSDAAVDKKARLEHRRVDGSSTSLIILTGNLNAPANNENPFPRAFSSGDRPERAGPLCLASTSGFLLFIDLPARVHEVGLKKKKKFLSDLYFSQRYFTF